MRRLSQKKKASAQENAAGAGNSTPAPKDSKKTPPKKRAQAARKDEGSEKVSSGTFEVSILSSLMLTVERPQASAFWNINSCLPSAVLAPHATNPPG